MNSSININIIGGGRWARVILEVISRIADNSDIITVYSKNNSLGMIEWISSKNLGRKILVFEDLPKKFTTDKTAVIIVNAARDHEKFILASLTAGASVLVEKPITLSYISGVKIAKAAKKLEKHLSSAHVFLFATYFINFSKLVLNAGKINRIDIHWEDPMVEDRYGEKKNYDSGLTVLSDWLPHVLSMISAIVPIKDFIFLSIELNRGGASVTLDILANHIPCRIILTRNGKSRKRLMNVNTETKVLKLNFSKEPGTIYDGLIEINGDNEWGINKSPLESMLKAFLKSVSNNIFDERLNIEIGLKSLKVIDCAMIEYKKKQFAWLIDDLTINYSNHQRISLNENIFYALSEIFQSKRALNLEELNKKIELFLFKVSKIKAEVWHSDLIKVDFNDAINKINDL